MNLTSSEFQRIRSRVYDYCGINLHEGKEALVRARVMKRIRKVGLNSFAEYMSYMEGDNSGAEFLALVDVLTTNKTSFFREDKHFDFIANNVIPEMKGRRVKWWSAGCSTGEEPISCAIALLEQQVRKKNVKILATDLSREVLRIAKAGVYASRSLERIPDSIRNSYFRKEAKASYRINDTVRNMITYGRLNLKKTWPLDGPFHVIMCRNVMIYFNRTTQEKLVSRFCDILEPGGYLFLGHSESVSGTNHSFKNIRPAVYQKK